MSTMERVIWERTTSSRVPPRACSKRGEAGGTDFRKGGYGRFHDRGNPCGSPAS